MHFYSVSQDDFKVQLFFAARDNSEARIRSLFLMTAMRGENAWGKKIHLKRVPTHRVQAPFFASSYFAELDPLLPKIRSYIRARGADQVEEASA